jgi:hypothetical protein
MKNNAKTKHLLGLSGGKDSAALAIYMRDTHPNLDIDYFFTDTGCELAEVYEFLSNLEAYLGKSILRLGADKNFDYYLRDKNNYLPSQLARWCTVDMKIKPFERYIKQLFNENGYDKIISYVALRADEPERMGMVTKDKRVEVKFPFKEDNLDKQDVEEILNNSVGFPKYYDWRSRSGCYFCFYQRKIEWVGLLENHPDLYEKAAKYEKIATDKTSKFTWIMGESLEELKQPARVQAIKDDWEKRRKAFEAKQKLKPVNLLQTQQAKLNVDEVFGSVKECSFCHK